MTSPFSSLTEVALPFSTTMLFTPGVDADLPAMGRKLRGKRARDIVHAAFDDADADVLHGGGKQPGEVGAERIVREQARHAEPQEAKK